MGIFNLFSKKPNDDNSIGFDATSRVVGEAPIKNGPLSVYHPKGYGDVENMIDDLKAGNQVMVYLTMVKETTKIRVLDLLSGAIYALGGGITETAPSVYLLSPTGISIK